MPIQVELQALQQALQIIVREKVILVEVEIDTTEIIRFLRDDYPTYNELIYDCRWLMEQTTQMGEIMVKHNFREANSVAHLLAKEALMQPSYNKLCTFVSPPESVIDAQHKDQEGFACVRKVSYNSCCKLAALSNDNALIGITIAHRGICNDGSTLPRTLVIINK